MEKKEGPLGADQFKGYYPKGNGRTGPIPHPARARYKEEKKIRDLGSQTY